jgi:hypothetical protein
MCGRCHAHMPAVSVKVKRSWNIYLASDSRRDRDRETNCGKT